MKSTIKRSLLLATVALVVPFATASLDAQDGKAGLVAILDVAKVFKQNTEFDTQMKLIKAEADSLKTQITKEQESIKAQAQQLSQYEVGSADRNTIEADLEQKQAALRTKARQAEANLLNREARIYFDTYQKMQSIVGNVANQHGISLVLRFDSDEIDSTNRAEVIKGVNRAVVYSHQLDLTTLVSTAMNERSAQAPTGTQNR